MQIAYFIVFKVLPCYQLGVKMVKDTPDLFKPTVSPSFRYTNRKQFDKEIQNKRNPFCVLASCIIHMQNHPESNYGMLKDDNGTR